MQKKIIPHQINKRLLSIILPVFNEEENIYNIYSTLTTILKLLVYFDCFELIFVDDGSYDTSLNILRSLAHQDTRIKVASFTRNFGHEHATFAGITLAQGDGIVIMDADLQDPPEVILKFEKEFASQSYDIVYGKRVKRLQEPWLKKTATRYFGKLFRRITNIDIPLDTGDFCLFNKKVARMVRSLPDCSLFVRGMIYWGGFSKKEVFYIRQGRRSGSSHYNYFSLAMLGLEGLLSFSIKPLYYIFFISLFVFIGGFFIATTGMLCILLGFHQILYITFFICFFLLFTEFVCIGTIGLYLGKVFQEVKRRPRFVVQEYINIQQHQQKHTPHVHESTKNHQENLGSMEL